MVIMMNKCNKCNVYINTKTSKCPLCGCNINSSKGENVFPHINYLDKKYHLMKKILLFLSLCGIFVSLYINYSITHTLSWSYFVVLGIITFWITLIISLNSRKNLIKMLFLEMIILIILSLIWDYSTGFKLWSINYLLPFIIVLYLTLIFIIKLFIKRLESEFVFYASVSSLIGLIPGLLVLLDKLHVYFPSYICSILSIVMLIYLFVFNKKIIKDELEKRFHI